MLPSLAVQFKTMNIYLYCFILSILTFLTPFVWFLVGLKPKKTKPVSYPEAANSKLEKSYCEQLMYP